MNENDEFGLVSVSEARTGCVSFEGVSKWDFSFTCFKDIN